MKFLILNLLVVGSLNAFADAYATEREYEAGDTFDTAVKVLGCQEITQAKSSFHILVERLNAGPHTSNLVARVFFNVESKPRITFTDCKGDESADLTCVDSTKQHFLKTFKTGSKRQFHVAVLRRTLPSAQLTNSFVCE